MTRQQLLDLQDYNLTDLARKIREFRKQWSENKLCDCKVVEGCELNCEHLKAYLKDFFKEEEKEIMEITNKMLRIDLEHLKGGIDNE